MEDSSATSFPLKHPSLPFSPPPSVLIIGSGVFGLGTAYALARRDTFSKTSITLVDRAANDAATTDNPSTLISHDASSVDSSRIIRSDYADPAYTALAAEAQRHWRKTASPSDLGAEGRYTESGLVLVADGVPPEGSGGGVPLGSSQPGVVKKTGLDYVRSSWENTLELSKDDPQLASRIRELPNAAAIRDAVGTGGASGSWGYVNGCAGWADAGKSMAWLYEKTRETGRVEFVQGTVTSLIHDENTVTGANLSDGRSLSADLVVLATGAWTASLLDLDGQATATGQVVGYVDISEEEQEKLGKMPTLLNLSTGLFIIPPSNRVLKIARHGYGYFNPVHLPIPPLSSLSSSQSHPSPPQMVSYPRTDMSHPALFSIPDEGAADLRRALREMIPLPEIHNRPFTRTRLCWYTDTAQGDFLISYHPRYRGLFVATGGSGHGFKFLPVLGDKIADCIQGWCPRPFREKWAWKGTAAGRVRTAWDAVTTEDGSRGGKAGLTLDEELRASASH